MRVILFSKEEYFVKVFGDYLEKKQRYDLYVCTEEAAVKAALQQKEGAVLLSGETLDGAETAAMACIWLGTETVPVKDKRGSLNIYQRAADIFEDLEGLLAAYLGVHTVQENESNLFCFFSTEGGSGKTTLAYLTAVTCANRKKTAYINLEPLAVTSQLYRQDYPDTMETLLFKLQAGEDLQTALAENLKRNRDNVYTLPNIQSIGDYIDIGPEEILRLLEEVAERGGMEVIIVDLPCMFTALTEGVMEDCKSVVWVYSDTKNGKEKRERMQNDPYLKGKGLLSKSIFVKNRCKSDVREEEGLVRFPSSQTMCNAEYVSDILQINEAFRSGCEEIVKQAVL